MNVLQNIIFPHMTFHAPEEMYVRLSNEKVYASLNSKTLIFQNGGKVSFDTYFNSLSVQPWQKNCKIDDLKLYLQGEGEFLIRIGIHRIGYASYWLDEKVIALKNDQMEHIEVSDWQKLDSGMLFFTVQALGEGRLEKGFWATETRPQQDVKLGIVVTHFNRKQWVLPAVSRIHDELLTAPIFKGKVELIIVDNSQNITAEELTGKTYGITVIPNKNLGGSGGFTRGLLHLKDRQDFTHCLFMDDDASCEIDSIKRTYNILSYGKTERLAVAGALLREIEPFRLFEKGATFDGRCHPLKSGMDMRHVHDLLFAELNDITPDYGGWWFFAFKINEVKEYAFPFFVRGDDSRFCMQNQFAILTMNGIACWAEDFLFKHGPLPAYLDTRYHILYAILQNNQRLALNLSKNLIIGQLFSYNYASAQACRIAVEHVMQGPDFFLKNMDMAEVRQQIGSLLPSEKLTAIDRASLNIKYRFKTKKEERWHRWLRKITLNGFRLPEFALNRINRKNRTIFQHKSFQGNAREIFGYRKVIYEYEPTHTGYVAEMNKELFFREYGLMKKMLKDLSDKFDTLHQQYAKAVPDMTSEQFWRGVYKED